MMRGEETVRRLLEIRGCLFARATARTSMTSA